MDFQYQQYPGQFPAQYPQQGQQQVPPQGYAIYPTPVATVPVNPNTPSIVPVNVQSGDGVNFDSNVRVIETMKGASSHVEVTEYKRLRGVPEIFFHSGKSRVLVPSLYNLQGLYFSTQIGLHLKEVKIVLRDSHCRLEAGAMYYMRGNIEIEAKIGGFGKALGAIMTKETVVKPKYKGTGEIYLQPSYGYFALVYLNSEECAVENGMYYASEGTIDVSVVQQKTLATGLFGGDGFFQVLLKGTGWVVLHTPVPLDEIQKVKLNNDKLVLDAHFALLRKGAIDYTIEKAAKGVWGTVISGEGLVHVYRGLGEVWIAPTLGHYYTPPLQQ